MFGERQALLRKFVAGDSTNHLSVTVYHGLTTTNQVNEPYDSIGVCKSQLVNKSNSSVGGTEENIFSVEKSLLCRPLPFSQ